MLLKSLEIRGFKSFADKTELKFRSGVTAVVGPNGSGKSNISDAVRWVLGEQSVKTLRGGKMEDVIFAGTQFRKPVGLAQVSLTLDNSKNNLPIAYSDVTVTRRIFRSGESEYLINNSPCRLKDITALFMDTGIGKEGYSLIGQGKIEAILSGRPEERRALLEEAAGIVKFKSRKEEAEKKLSNTDANLVRINDIILTYEERIDPLRLEMEKANKFLELSKDLKEKEVSLIIYHIKDIDKQIKENEERYLSVKKERENLYIEMNEKKKSLSEYQQKLEALENEFNYERNSYFKSKEQVKELESNIGLLKEKIHNIESLVDKSEKEVEEINSKIDYYLKEKADLEILLEQKYIEKNSIDLLIKSMEKKNDDSSKILFEKQQTLQNLKDEEFEAIRKTSELKNSKILLLNQLESIKDVLKSLSSSSSDYENSLKINLSTKIMLENKILSIQDEIESIEEKTKIKKKDISALNLNISKLERELKNLSDKATRLEANHNLLINLEKQYEGYNKSVKILMDHITSGKLNINNKKCAVVGEVITVKKEYETSLEVALGSTISNVITEDEIVAKYLINYLKDRKIGRATFLPLTIIKGNALNLSSVITSLDGYIGIASELVEYDKKYENAINYILGRTIICDNMDNGLKIAKATSYNYRIVTLLGEIINPGGALTGGSIYHKHTSIISRKREIDELSLSITEIRKTIQEYTQKIEANLQQVKVLDEECLNLRDEVHFNKVEIAKIENEIININKDTDKIRLNIKTSQNEISINEKKIRRIELNIKENNEQYEALSIRNNNLRQNIATLDNEIIALSEKINTEKEILTEQKIKKAQIDEIVLNKTNELSRIEREINELEVKIELLKSLVIQNHDRKKEYFSSIKNKEVEIDKLKVEIFSLEENEKTLEINRATLKEKIKDIESKFEDLSLQVKKKEEFLHKIDIQKTKNEVEKENYFIKLNEELGLTYAEALNISEEVENVTNYASEILSLKGKISALGTVNVSCIEEYKEVSEKYKFMSAERDDLEKAREELVSVIKEMTEKMKAVFKENFEILNYNFNETFVELFKGGSAELILGDGDELTANIDINVQPPGKKLQNINLMSGGEKVLSAIALLFAILKMKPTPFCILDEIEAALDDANVYRYAEFLKKFSEKIQFIVITHRKGTMEASDVMYGVTMEEKGVSKVVSVDLTK